MADRFRCLSQYMEQFCPRYLCFSGLANIPWTFPTSTDGTTHLSSHFHHFPFSIFHFLFLTFLIPNSSWLLSNVHMSVMCSLTSALRSITRHQMIGHYFATKPLRAFAYTKKRSAHKTESITSRVITSALSKHATVSVSDQCCHQYDRLLTHCPVSSFLIA